jgi:hypothetical protein
MYIEHFVSLAGAYNLGFFIELAEYFIFYFFYFLNCYCVQKGETKFFVYIQKRETATNHTPVYTFGLGYPPMTKANLFIFKTQITMKKINQIATISDVSLNDKLKEWNEENEAFRVQLRIAYAAESSKDDNDEDLLSLADFEEAGASVGKTYTCLINFDSLLTDKHTEKEQDKALTKLVEKFKGKKARFSTFDFTISELTDGKEKAINDGTHTYSSLANTYLGSVEDEESEFNKLKNRMLDMVDNDFDFGQADED